MNVIHDKDHTCSCGCSGYGMGMMGGRKYHLLKKLIMLIILVIVFWFGTKLGELKALVQYSRGEHMMMRDDGDMMNDYMMGGDTTQAPTPAQ